MGYSASKEENATGPHIPGRTGGPAVGGSGLGGFEAVVAMDRRLRHNKPRLLLMGQRRYNLPGCGSGRNANFEQKRQVLYHKRCLPQNATTRDSLSRVHYSHSERRDGASI